MAVNFCSYCHQTLKIHKDSLSVNHGTLVEQKRWDTCLGCHDYHGNHIMKLKTQLSERWQEKAIQAYFNGNLGPYPVKKHYKAKTDVREKK